MAVHSDENEAQTVEDQPEAPHNTEATAGDKVAVVVLVVISVLIVLGVLAVVISAAFDAVDHCSPSVSQLSGTVQGC